MSLSPSTQAVNRHQPALHWSLWLLLAALLAVGGSTALPSLQALQPQTAADPAQHLLADEWRQHRWLVASRALLRQHVADRDHDEHAPPQFAAAWLAADPVSLPAAGCVAVASCAPIQLPSLPVHTRPGAPRGPPAAFV